VIALPFLVDEPEGAADRRVGGGDRIPPCPLTAGSREAQHQPARNAETISNNRVCVNSCCQSKARREAGRDDLEETAAP